MRKAERWAEQVRSRKRNMQSIQVIQKLDIGRDRGRASTKQDGGFWAGAGVVIGGALFRAAI
jgi:hypothetical protein